MPSNTHYDYHYHRHQHHHHHHHHSSSARYFSLPFSSSSSSYLYLFTLSWLCLFLMQLHSTRGAVEDNQATEALPSNNIISGGSRNKTPPTPQLDCRQDPTMCPVELNQSCNQSSGACSCPPSAPILLSAEIPCLRAKLLGQVCLHSRECASVGQAACYATILFPLELQSVPSHRQWYIYSQITESGELNYLLNKVYGQCRCRSGYRAVSPDRCVPKDGASTGRSCAAAGELQTLNSSIAEQQPQQELINLTSNSCLPNSHCDQMRQQCVCDSGFVFDDRLQSCSPLQQHQQQRQLDRLGQFCVVNSDCQADGGDPNLQCSKSRCVCAQGFSRSTNATACPVPRDCSQPGQSWNAATLACESHSSLMFDSLLVKIVLLLLLKLIICNLVRIACYSKRIAAAADAGNHGGSGSSSRHRGSRFFESTRQVADQSRSLLSLPPYESICQQSDSASSNISSSDGSGLSVSASHFDLDSRSDSLPPTYEEALQTMGADADISAGGAADDSCKAPQTASHEELSLAVS